MEYAICRKKCEQQNGVEDEEESMNKSMSKKERVKVCRYIQDESFFFVVAVFDEKSEVKRRKKKKRGTRGGKGHAFYTR